MAVGGFNSSSDRAEALGLPLSTTSFTLTMWVKSHTANSGTLNYPLYCTGTTVPILRFNGSDVPELTDSSSTYTLAIGSAISLDTWYFLAISVNGTTGKIYRGTEAAAVTSNSGTVPTHTAADAFLMYGTSNFSADVSQVRLWNAVLSDAEVEAERTSSTPVRTSGLTADWRFVNAAGKATDSSGNGHTLGYVSGSWSDATDPSPIPPVTGTAASTQSAATSATTGWAHVTGTAATTQGNATSSASGQALERAGAVAFNAHADRLYRASLPIANTAYTVTMWVRPQAGGGQHEFFFESDAAGTTYCLASNNGVLGILNAGGGFVYNVTLGSAMTDNVWYFIAMTISGTTGNLYRGDESTAVSNASGTIAAQGASYRVYIGSDGSSSSYPCVADIAHVRLWDAVLTGTEIEAERQALTPVRTANLTADWRMADVPGKLTDSSGNGRTLTAASTGPWLNAQGPLLPVTGPAASTQSAATSAASGSTVVGTAVSAQSAATSVTDGGHGVSGSGTSAQDAATSTGVAFVAVAGTAVSAQDAATSAASGSTVVGTASSTQSASTSAATGASGAAGTSAITQDAATSAGAGVFVPSGTSAVTQSDATSATSGAFGSVQSHTGASVVTQSSVIGYINGHVGATPARHVQAEQVATMSGFTQAGCSITADSATVAAS